MPECLPDLTIAIPVRNEERNLEVCLEAIGPDFASRVLVIDSASTDGTADVARRHGAEMLNFIWDGGFPKKRNWFLRHHTPTTPWVLFLDADEILSPQVKREITEALQHVDSLDDDRVLRRLALLVNAIQRTNYYQLGPDGQPRP